MISTKMAFYTLPMVLLLQTALAVPINNTQSSDEECANLLEINGNYFLLDETKAISGIPADIHVHWKSGDVYYTLVTISGNMAVYVINKQTGQEKKIIIAGGQSTAVDNTNNVIYLATDIGVYKQKEDGSTELYAASGKDVLFIALTKDASIMYITTHPDNAVYKITQDGRKMETFSAVPNDHGITVDHKGNIFFSDSQTAYVLKAGEMTPIKIAGLPGDKIFDFYVTKTDKVFAMADDSHLYHVDEESMKASDWGSFGLTEVYTFGVDDKDDMYIGVDGAIKKFKHYDTNPCVKV